MEENNIKKLERVTKPVKENQEYNFEEQMKINQALKDRKAKEKLEANKQVLREYRIRTK